MQSVHINAKLGDFAETVLLPGDPLRAKFVAENFLTEVKQVTNIRNMNGYTGYYKNARISVMGAGMGIPSCSIYAHELINVYGVKNIIRIGTAGGLKGCNIGDIVLINGASTNSLVNRRKLNGYDLAAVSDFTLLHKIYNHALQHNIKIKVGSCFSEDLFYAPEKDLLDILEKMNIFCVEMEAAGLFTVAMEYKARATAIVTISDIINNKDFDISNNMTAIERETKLSTMIELALSAALN